MMNDLIVTETLPWFLPTREAQVERENILRNKFFLVKIAGNGDVWKCRNCGNKHRYLTLMCIEQPFSGLTHGLWAYYRTVGLQGAENILPPSQRLRYQQLARLFAAGAPDLATSHPETARALLTNERDADVGAFSLGLLEPITKQKAQQLVHIINGRGIKPSLELQGLDPVSRGVRPSLRVVDPGSRLRGHRSKYATR